ALGLLGRGHEPIVYSRRLGRVAEALREETVPVLGDLDHCDRPPDLIHAQHHLEAMTALARFPNTPAIYVCHGWLPDQEAPPRHPRIVRYVAVDDLVRQRLVDECGLDEPLVETQLNFVDLDRFRRRPTPLPEAPRRALVLSHYASESTILPALRSACRAHGITLDVVGSEAGRPSDAPETWLADADIVFAKGRSALEAATVGASVVLCDRSGLGPIVTADTLDHLRRFNFGVRLLRRPVTTENIEIELARYDAADATRVTEMLRPAVDLEAALDAWIDRYRHVVDGFDATTVDRDDEARAMAGYLRHGPLRGGDLFEHDRQALRAELARIGVWAKALERDVVAIRASHAEAVRQLASATAEQAAATAEQERLSRALEGSRSEVGQLQAEVTRLHAEIARLRAEAVDVQAAADRHDERARHATQRTEALETELDWMRDSATWRWRQRIVGRRGLAALYRQLRKR
ncbi:MAG: hypothetical protein AAGE94_11330, partial [Acidobacteriota bacterium]